MDIESNIRKLARSSYWQNIFQASKENGGIHLFENLTNFSGLQSTFLYWLGIYSTIYDDLIKHENNFLTEKYIKDNERINAYLYWRRKKNEADWRKYNQEKDIPEVKNKCRDNLTTFTVEMKRP